MAKNKNPDAVSITVESSMGGGGSSGGQGGRVGRPHWRMTHARQRGTLGTWRNKSRKREGRGAGGFSAGRPWWSPTKIKCQRRRRENPRRRSDSGSGLMEQVSRWSQAWWFHNMSWMIVRRREGITAPYKCNPSTMWRGKLRWSFRGIGLCGVNPSVYQLSWFVCEHWAAALSILWGFCLRS